MRRKLAVGLATAFGVAAIAAPTAQADKVCVEEGKNKNWTETVVQQTGCPSNPAPHEDEERVIANTNKGGNEPGGHN